MDVSESGHKITTSLPSITKLTCCLSLIGPGTFIEVVKILPLLTEPSNGPSFHVVAPSLPNYGFSQAVSKPGFSIQQYAETLHKLMLKLGYDKYGKWIVLLGTCSKRFI